MNIIPFVWTLPIHPVGQNYTANDTFLIKSVPRIKAVTEVSASVVSAATLGKYRNYIDGKAIRSFVKDERI